MLRLAETPTRFEHLAPGETRLDTPDGVVFFAEHGACSVQGLRIGDGLEATVARVRHQILAHGHTQATWEVLSSVHPRTVIDHLIDLGMHPAEPPLAVIMAASTAPRAPAPNLVVTTVDTVAEFKAHVTLTHEIFGKLDQLPDELARIEATGAKKLADRSFVRYVARLDGLPVGAATATFTTAGVMLHSGCTLHAYRGRGVYTALVHHRWLEAQARGTPHLITRAGPMSRPILRRLGFDELGEVHFLTDVLSQAAIPPAPA